MRSAYDLVADLREAGYVVFPDGQGGTRFEYVGDEEPDPDIGMSLLRALKANNKIVARFLEDQIQQMRTALDHQGWALIESGVLGGDHIVIVVDHTTQIPSELDGCLKYTLREVRILGKRGMPSPDDLRQVHMVKREFEGTVGDQTFPPH